MSQRGEDEEMGRRSPGAHPVAQRPLTPDDLSDLEELRDAELSPDGRWLAYVRTRPRRTATVHKYDFLSGGDRGDVWIVDTARGRQEPDSRR